MEGEITSEKRPLKDGETMEWILLTGVSGSIGTASSAMIGVRLTDRNVQTSCRHQRRVRILLYTISTLERLI